eukprot:6009175-Pyramimonas_sp.AAC.1
MPEVHRTTGDKSMTTLEAPADMSTQGSNAREAPLGEQPQDDGLLPTLYEESEADREAHITEVWCVKLQDERELLEAPPVEELSAVPTRMIPDNSVLVTVTGEQ